MKLFILLCAVLVNVNTQKKLKTRRSADLRGLHLKLEGGVSNDPFPIILFGVPTSINGRLGGKTELNLGLKKNQNSLNNGGGYVKGRQSLAVAEESQAKGSHFHDKKSQNREEMAIGGGGTYKASSNNNIEEESEAKEIHSKSQKLWQGYSDLGQAKKNHPHSKNYQGDEKIWQEGLSDKEIAEESYSHSKNDQKLFQEGYSDLDQTHHHSKNYQGDQTVWQEGNSDEEESYSKYSNSDSNSDEVDEEIKYNQKSLKKNQDQAYKSHAHPGIIQESQIKKGKAHKGHHSKGIGQSVNKTNKNVQEITQATVNVQNNYFNHQYPEEIEQTGPNLDGIGQIATQTNQNAVQSSLANNQVAYGAGEYDPSDIQNVGYGAFGNGYNGGYDGSGLQNEYQTSGFENYGYNTDGYGEYTGGPPTVIDEYSTFLQPISPNTGWYYEGQYWPNLAPGPIAGWQQSTAIIRSKSTPKS